MIKKEPMDSLDSLWNHLELTFGQRMLPEGAFKELQEHLTDKDFCKKDYLSFATKLRVLASASKNLVVSQVLINTLFKMQEHDVRMLLLGFGKDNWPSEWEEFLDKTIEYYKEAFSERVRGSIYGKSGHSSDKKDPHAMDIDSAKKQKARSTSTTKEKDFDPC